MTKKDGSLMANLVDPNTNKIISTISLKSVKIAPEITKALTDYATQMQMIQIAEQIQSVQVAVEEVRKGQEYDRLANSYAYRADQAQLYGERTRRGTGNRSLCLSKVYKSG